MIKKTANTAVKKKKISLVKLMYIILITALVSTTTLSRYLTQTAGGDTSVLASAVLDEYAVVVPLSGIVPGGTYEYIFAVTNEENGVVCDVTQDYSLTITGTNNLPLILTLSAFNYEDDEVIEETDIHAIEQDDDSSVFSGGEFQHTDKEVHYYQLTVYWDENEADWNLSKEIELITITADSWQQVA
ncbi:MAG: hypothetical protein R3Y27_02780 [Clostridia bacterium]